MDPASAAPNEIQLQSFKTELNSIQEECDQQHVDNDQKRQRFSSIFCSLVRVCFDLLLPLLCAGRLYSRLELLRLDFLELPVVAAALKKSHDQQTTAAQDPQQQPIKQKGNKKSQELPLDLPSDHAFVLSQFDSLRSALSLAPTNSRRLGFWTITRGLCALTFVVLWSPIAFLVVPLFIFDPFLRVVMSG